MRTIAVLAARKMIRVICKFIGTIGACFLASGYGLSSEDALARVQRAFATRGDAGKHSAILFWGVGKEGEA